RHTPPAHPRLSTPDEWQAERFIRTMLGGWAYGAIYRDSAERSGSLEGWLWHYNHRRGHSALGHKPPGRSPQRANQPSRYLHLAERRACGFSPICYASLHSARCPLTGGARGKPPGRALGRMTFSRDSLRSPSSRISISAIDWPFSMFATSNLRRTHS